MSYEFKSPAPFAFDRRSPGSEFIRARKAEAQYGLRLRKIARHIGDIVHTLWDGANPMAAGNAIEDALRRFAPSLDGWANAVGRRMVADVANRDRQAWMEIARRMGRSLKEEIETAPTGVVMRQRLAEQVSLIKSLPTEAAERVHKLTVEGLVQGRRASDIAQEIARTGEVTKARANTIARTEVSRTGTALTRARAEHIGSVGYIWRTAGDSDVRHSHQGMNGKFVRWDSPPTLDGMTGHAGEFPNCRCYPEPVFAGSDVVMDGWRRQDRRPVDRGGREDRHRPHSRRFRIASARSARGPPAATICSRKRTAA